VIIKENGGTYRVTTRPRHNFGFIPGFGTRMWDSEYGLRNPSCTQTQTFVIHHLHSLLPTSTYKNTKITLRRPPQLYLNNCRNDIYLGMACLFCNVFLIL